ncbi:MAG: PA2778 family cysteine peptidase [Pseudomonadota bacterium]
MLCGCTAIIVANEVVPKKPEIKPGDIYIDVPFIAQKKYYCGPATLAMVSDYYGRDITSQQIEHLMLLPVLKGTLQVEMQATTRSLDMAAFTMHMDRESLIAAIDQERPVIVLQNLSLDIYPRWHYAVVVGRSPNTDHLLLHSGEHEYYRVRWQTFENTWKRSGKWALMPLPPGELPGSVTQQQALKAALDLEKTGKIRAAQMTYEAITQRWPDSFNAYVGLANTHMTLKEPLAASKAYQQALKMDKYSTSTLNNFAYSAYDLGCEITAISAANCAVKMSGSNERILSTLNELKAKSQAPSNHEHCPHIVCKGQTIARLDL